MNVSKRFSIFSTGVEAIGFVLLIVVILPFAYHWWEDKRETSIFNQSQNESRDDVIENLSSEIDKLRDTIGK